MRKWERLTAEESKAGSRCVGFFGKTSDTSEARSGLLIEIKVQISLIA